MRLIFQNLTYQKPGGAENLVYQIVKTAYEEFRVTSVLIGVEESFVRRRLDEVEIPYVSCKSTEVSQLATYHDDLFVYFHNFIGINNAVDCGGNALIWVILAEHILEWNKNSIENKYPCLKFIGKIFTRKLVRSMLSKKSFISMDGATSDAIRRFTGDSSEIPILAIPIDTNDARPICIPHHRKKNFLTISYIGRSDDIWKIKPVKKIINDLNYVQGTEFFLNIYTDAAEPFIKEIGPVNNPALKIKYHTGLYGAKLRDHLVDNSDIHFSMGTSALEGALAGLPTILMDACKYEFPEGYRYRWLYQSDRCSLGRFIDNDMEFEGITMEELIGIIKDDNLFLSIAERCQSHVMSFHDQKKITKSLLSQVAAASNKNICRYTLRVWGAKFRNYLFKKDYS